MSILLVGAGRMGVALLKGWLKRGVGPVIVVEPKPSPELRKLAKAKKHHAGRRAVAGEGEKLSACVVAIKPQILKGEAPVLADFARSGALMISIAAGTHTKSLFKAWGAKARIIRAMPNTPGAIGQGITGLFAAKGATAADKKQGRRAAVGAGRNRVGGQGRSDRQRHRCVRLRPRLSVPDGRSDDRGGRGRRPAARPGRETGPRHRGRRGRACWRRTNRPPRALREAVTSPGGTTAAALKVLMAEDGLVAADEARHSRGAQAGGRAALDPVSSSPA